jgi:diacylglycerol kinase (ATP)
VIARFDLLTWNGSTRPADGGAMTTEEGAARAHEPAAASGETQQQRLPGPWHLIVNPRAGNGTVGKRLPELTRALDGKGLEWDLIETARPGHAAEAAREALQAGRRFLCAVGGDGTVHEVVNGMFDGTSPRNAQAVLATVGAGSGCDFVRTFGLDRKPEIVARHLATPTYMPIDVGLVRCTGRDGEPHTRLFANIAEVGYGAEVVRRAARYPRWFGRFRYLFGAYGSIRAMTRPETTVVVEHTEVTVPLVELVVANCQFFGGGMKVAPRALPDDGRFNVQLFTGQRSQVFVLTQKLYRGEHLPHPDIREYQSPTVRVDGERPLLIEADGELIGTTPATFEILSRALHLKI